MSSNQKHKCSKCNKLATWYYAPWSTGKIEENDYYYDNCVSRGCYYELTNNFNKDELGRLLPCCEYDDSQYGFDVER